MNPAQANVKALAFVGDAVYELYIRNMICGDLSLGGNADLMHKKAIRYVRAESQAEDELGLVKRARNHKTPNRSRSAGAVEYKLATAFEALIGFLHANGDEERVLAIMSKAVEIIEEE